MVTTFVTGENPLRADKLNTAFGERVNRTGDTMTGSLLLDHDPEEDLEAATKQYVENAIAAVPTQLRMTSVVTSPIVVTGTIGAEVSAAIYTYAAGATYLMLLTSSDANSVDSNHDVELFDGPPIDGRLVYQATGITGMDYADVTPFYLYGLLGTQLYVRITNNTAVALTTTINVRFITINE